MSYHDWLIGDIEAGSWQEKLIRKGDTRCSIKVGKRFMLIVDEASMRHKKGSTGRIYGNYFAEDAPILYREIYFVLYDEDARFIVDDKGELVKKIVVIPGFRIKKIN